MPSSNRHNLTAILLAAATLGLVCAAGCRRPAIAPAAANVTVSEFVGSAACAPCHAAEFKAQSASRHALTMRPADRRVLGSLAPPDGPVDRVAYKLEDHAGQLVAERSGGGAQPLDLALGSGKTGMTYVAVLADASLLEAKMSYFPRWHRWEVTPGQEKPHRRGDGPFGHAHSPETGRKCLGCHSVTLPAAGLAPEPAYYGVGCESCHGPGRTHIAAVRAGDTSDPHLDRLGTWGSTQLNEMCGKCHRTEHDINLESPDARQTQRFQPYALVRSACRTASGDVLSCRTCHDPHTNANPDHHSYEAACLKCHSTAAAHSDSAQTLRTCPVNPKTDCIRCHMPARNPFPNTNVPTWIVDHRIAVPQR